MIGKTTRRRFLGTTAALAAATAFNLKASSKALANTSSENPFKTKLHKALICAEPTDEICANWSKAGIEGMETSDWNVTPEKAEQKRIMAQKHGLKIHSVMRGWAKFNNDDEAVVRTTIEETKTSIRAAAAYGASTILLVPCRIDGMAMPKPWDFNIDFDPKTCMVKKVVDGDNAPYADYIKAQNRSTEMSIQAIEELIPLAAEYGIIIGVENVWNNLWVKPELLNAFVNYFDNIWVKMYLDLGNHVKYAPTEQWLEVGGSNIVKLHIKDFILDKTAKDGGFFSDLGDGTIDWKSVRKAIDKANYNGWMSVETSNLSDEEHNKRLDSIIAGNGWEN